ncbi:hypothetical protein PENSPDRAFT_492854 [Peniophora sp. CONT]|nr:hypothetical protein PENSPDRAFT_492854 [Peniophora sp. CONT]
MADPWAELAHVRLCTRPIGATSDEHKQYLDKEITSLESVVARARQLRNLENPFVSLPEEVLLLIISVRQGCRRPARVHGRVWLGYGWRVAFVRPAAVHG